MSWLFNVGITLITHQASNVTELYHLPFFATSCPTLKYSFKFQIPAVWWISLCDKHLHFSQAFLKPHQLLWIKLNDVTFLASLHFFTEVQSARSLWGFSAIQVMVSQKRLYLGQHPLWIISKIVTLPKQHQNQAFFTAADIFFFCLKLNDSLYSLQTDKTAKKNLILRPNQANTKRNMFFQCFAGWYNGLPFICLFWTFPLISLVAPDPCISYNRTPQAVLHTFRYLQFQQVP